MTQKDRPCDSFFGGFARFRIASTKQIVLFNAYEKSNIYMFKSRNISKYVDITIVIRHDDHAILE
jgi:hypothetical protein